MPCGKEEYVEVIKVIKGTLFGFLQVDIHILDELIDKFSEFCPLFIMDSIPDELIPSHMCEYQIRGTKKLLGVMPTEKILLYSPMLKWYLKHGLKVTAIHKYLKYEPSRAFNWFPKEASKALNGDNDPSLKELGDTHKLKGNSFYGKIIGDLMKHLQMTFTTNEELVDESFRLSFFEDLEEINTAFKIKEHKQQVTIMRPYQYGITVYQLAKFCMWEFYYDFLDKYLD